MRFLFLPIVAALTVASSVAPESASPSARPVVILVHGRGHLEDDSAAVKRDWKRDLDSALKLVGMPRLATDDVRLAWYADIMDPASETACDDRSSDDSLGFVSFVRGFFGSLASALPMDESRDARGLIGDMLYAMDWSKRCATERRVGAVIEGALAEKRPVVIVAYSLGSLVAYGYLNSRTPSEKQLAELRLVTMGSPLGVPEIRELLGLGSDAPRLPPGVSDWDNVYDPNDALSGPLATTVTSKGVRDRVTESNAGEYAHHVGRYLRDRSTGRAVARALCGASRNQFDEACTRL